MALAFFEANSNISWYLDDLTVLDEESSLKNEKIVVFAHPLLGRILVLGSEIQHIESLTQIYHETLVHLPTCFIRNLETVLILGGGDLYAAKEVLKYTSVKKLVLIEHDELVIEVMKRNYHHANEVLSDPRIDLRIDDAFEFLKDTNMRFDLVISDCVDILEVMKSTEVDLFNLIRSVTNPEGVCADLVYRHIFERKTTIDTINQLKLNNQGSVFSLVTIPEYSGVMHILAIWGDNENLNQNTPSSINTEHIQWLRNNDLRCDYFNPQFLNYYLYLPPYLKQILDGIKNF
jgi:spermidine synthase